MPAIAVDAYVVDTLMPDLVGHDRQPSAFLVYLAISRRARGAGAAGVALSLRELAECTGLSKRAVQLGIRALERRRLLHVTRESMTAVPRYTPLRPWARRARS